MVECVFLLLLVLPAGFLKSLSYRSFSLSEYVSVVSTADELSVVLLKASKR